MKNRSWNILIVSLLLIGLISIMLTIFLGQAKENFPKKITVSSNGVTERILSVRDLQLVPTESREYSTNLFCEASGSYFIYLDYVEGVDGGMKHFVDVVVKANNEVVYLGPLVDLLDGDKVIEFEGELYEKEPLAVTIRYVMPYHIGNEAQGTYADFDIHLKIQKS